MNKKNNLQISTWITPTKVFRRWIPMSFGVFLIGNVISATVMTDGQILRMEDAIISDILSPINNPKGYLIAVNTMVLSGLLLLPTATIFQNGWRHPYNHWSFLGAWLYRIGLIVLITVGITTPLQMPYMPIHVWLAFAAFIAIIGGLAICLILFFCSSIIYRLPFAALTILMIIALVFLVYIFFIPDYFNDRRWLLALSEWLLNALIATGIFTMTKVKVRLEN